MVSPGDVLLVGGGCVLELLGPGVRVVVILVPPRRACSGFEGVIIRLRYYSPGWNTFPAPRER